MHWASARCLATLGFGAAGPLGPPPTLSECLMPLTREFTPLLATCLVASPWRFCRLAIRYVAFRASALLISAFGSPGEWTRRRQELLPKLLDEIHGALEDGWARHEEASRNEATATHSVARSIGDARAMGGGSTPPQQAVRDCLRMAVTALTGTAGTATFTAGLMEWCQEQTQDA